MSTSAAHAGAQVPANQHSSRVGAIWIAYGVLGALLLAYLGLLVARPAGESSTLIDGWLVVAFELVAVGLCIGRGLGRRKGRLVPLVLGASILSWTVGDLVRTIESLGGAEPPTPSLADAFYLGFFPLAYVGIVLFIRGEVRRLNSPSWLDSIVAALGAAAVCAAFAFHSLLYSAGGSALAVATNLAYPVGDLLLLALVVGSAAMLAGRSRLPWLLLGTGMALNAVGDTFNLFGSGVGSSHAGVIVNGIAWPTAILLISMAMWVPSGRSDPLVFQKPPGFLLPGLAATLCLVIMLAGSLSHPGPVAIGLATATLVMVGIRLSLSVRSMRALTQKRQHQSVTDHLTGLGNRRFLSGMLDGFFEEETGSTPRQLAFLYIDLNGFKEINDSFGHPAGDELLRQLGERFRRPLGDSDALIRLGGDEFAAVLLDAGADHATKVAQRLTASLEEPFVLDAVRMHVSASIGIARASVDAAGSDDLIACADVAMYRAKLADEPFALYERDFDDTGNLLRLADELRIAWAEGGLLLHYQPQLDMRTGGIHSVEALLRWPHPRLGMVPPLKFLPLAERAGLMRGLTEWVLGEALNQCASWRVQGGAAAVSVNVSATNVVDAGFTAMVQDLLERHRLPPEALVLEITETSIITEFDRATIVVEELRNLGIVVSIDDFGTGFTSLAYLSGLPAGELKLDRTFITPLTSGERDRDLQLVRSTIELGHALGMRVVAEGIEDEGTLDLLRDLKCDVAQGYFIGMPEPAENIAFAPAAREQGNGTAGRRAPAGELPAHTETIGRRRRVAVADPA